MSFSPSNPNLSPALAKLARLEALQAAIAACSPFELATLFRLPLTKRDAALHRLQNAIGEERKYIERLQTTRVELPIPVNAAWARDIDAWRAQGGNCD